MINKWSTGVALPVVVAICWSPLVPKFQVLLPIGTNRGAFITAMKAHGIGIGVHYPALHLFSLYRRFGFKPGDFPHAEDVGARTVTLPLFPAMQDTDIDRVCAALTKVLANHS